MHFTLFFTCAINLDSLQNVLDETTSEITDNDDDSTDDSNELEQVDLTDEDFMPSEENTSSEEEGQYCKRSICYDHT